MNLSAVFFIKNCRYPFFNPFFGVLERFRLKNPVFSDLHLCFIFVLGGICFVLYFDLLTYIFHCVFIETLLFNVLKGASPSWMTPALRCQSF